MIDILLKGGLFMVPLVICSIMTLAVILERRRTLGAVLGQDLGMFREEVAAALDERDIPRARELCESTPGPIAAILGAGLRRYVQLREAGRSDDVVEEGVVKAMEDHAEHVVNFLERYLVILATVGNIAPLIGFLGTVTGMIKSFEQIAAKGGMKPEYVAGGISEALITTAAGLTIAIPAVVAYNYFTTKVQNYILEIEESATKVVELATVRPRDEETLAEKTAAEAGKAE